MPESREWTARRAREGNTEYVSLLQDGESISFRDMFELMQESTRFADWYSDLLARSPFAAYFWENPPLTPSRLDHAAEFVLVDAPGLARLQPNGRPFERYFRGNEIVVFENLGGDATLVAPSPGDPPAGYAHLAAFLRDAPAARACELWRNVAAEVARSLTGGPLWLSTSGLGVSWLHVRLDSTPKYYQHLPYKSRVPDERPGRC